MSTLVIIPTWNRPNMIARAVKSLLKQTAQDWHCVIVKNGGYDCASLYIRALEALGGDDRVALTVINQRGLAVAINYALAHYAADYPTWAVLEDDDEWKPRFLQDMRKALNGTDVAHCEQEQRPQPKQGKGRPMDIDLLQRHNWINWPMCLWRQSVYNRIGGLDPSAGPAADWDYHRRCTASGIKYQFVDKELVIRYWHDDNYSTQVHADEYIMVKHG